MITPETANLRTGELWDWRLSQAQVLRNYFEPIWEEALSWYMNLMQIDLPPGAEWMRGDMLADAFRMTESIIPQWILGMIEAPDHYGVVGATEGGEFYENDVRSYLDKSHANQKWVPRVAAAIRMGYVQGTLVQKTTWRREIGERMLPIFVNPTYNANGEEVSRGEFQGFQSVPELLHNGAWSDFPDLFKVWFSPLTDTIGNHLWTAEEMTISLDYMEEVNRQYNERTGSVIYHNLQKYRRTISGRPGEGHNGFFRTHFGPLEFSGRKMGSIPSTQTVGEIYTRRSSDTISSGIPKHLFAGGDGLTTMTGTGYVPRGPEGKTYPDTQWRSQMIGPDLEIIRDEPLPNWNRRPPHRKYPILQIGHEPYGRSPLHWVAPEIEMRSELRALRVAEIYTNLLGQYIKDKGVRMDDNILLRVPGGIQDIDTGGRPIDEVFRMLEKHPVRPEAFTEDRLLEDHQLRTIGLTDAFEGQPMGQRTSASEAMFVQNVASARTRMQIMLLSLGVELDSLIDTFELGRTFQFEEIQAQRPNGSQVPMSMHQLRYNIDIIIKAGELGHFNSMQLAAINQVLAQAGNLGNTLRVDWERVALEALRRSGVTETQRFERTDAEVEEIQNSQMVQGVIGQMLAQQFSPLGAGGGDSSLPIAA